VKVHLSASTSAKILVWREDELFHARSQEATGPIQVCLGVDLFEVVAELAGLDLEHGEQAAEAMRLADRAIAQLGSDATLDARESIGAQDPRGSEDDSEDEDEDGLRVRSDSMS
jgi:hypothetical protein